MANQEDESPISFGPREFWLANGYVGNPFENANADQEQHLVRYFVDPPYFPSVVGDANNPSAAVVFAPRGAGKSAQRLMVEERTEGPVLVVTYAEFPMADLVISGEVGIEYHLTNIIQHVLVGFISFIHDESSVKPDGEHLNMLASLCRTYLSDIDQVRLQDSLSALKSLRERHREFWRNWGPTFGTLAAYAIATLRGGIGPGPLVMGNQNEDVPVKNVLNDFRNLGRILEATNVRAVYVLVDRVDEIPGTHNDPSAAYKFIRSIMLTLPILETRPFAFKFFLTDGIRQLWTDDGGRTDRVQTFETSWSPEELSAMVKARLGAYRSPPTTEVALGTILPGQHERDLVYLFAQNSPRDLIRILNHCVAELTRFEPEKRELTSEAVSRGINTFCGMKAFELVDTVSISRLRQIHLVDFSIATASEHMDVGQGSVRRYVRDWERLGHVVKLQAQERTGGVGPPAISYGISDLRVARVALGDLSFDEFTQMKVRICPSGHAVVRDWGQWDEDYRHTCGTCGAPMVEDLED